ncbi:MAG: SDR family oxidoreductase [Nannocystaceae bacterium]|nr:SDR family oxidoreductase [Nannocystaceae bacterium]
MNQSSLDSRSIVVVGASRGLGRGMALAFARAGAVVHALSRDEAGLDSLRAQGDGRITTAVGDATREGLAKQVLETQQPDAFVIVAGAAPKMAPLRDYDWASLSRPWQVDVQIAFRWLQAALQTSFEGRAVVVSSGAALHGSPLSGGYAGAKQMQRFLAKYTADEAARDGSKLLVQTLLPQLNPNTELGRAGVAAYAQRAGVSPEAFVAKRFGTQPLSPEIAGIALVELFTNPERERVAEFMLSGKGLQPLGE